MRQSRTSGSVGAPGGLRPGPPGHKGREGAKKKYKGDEEMGGDGEMDQDLLDTLSLYLSCPRIPLVLVFPLRPCVPLRP